MSDICVLVSSCDAYSDLWQTHFDLLKKNSKGEMPPVYLITDKPTTFSFDGVTVLFFEGEMPARVKKAAEVVNCDRVLLTLDDYFVTSPIDWGAIGVAAKFAEDNAVDYLSLYDRRKVRKKHFKPLGEFERIDLKQRYAVNLYPAIWDKKFLSFTVTGDESPWKFEPTLTKKAGGCGANCYFCPSFLFPVLDVVRKGKVLSRANAYFKRNGIDIGDRPIIKKRTEIYLALADFISWHSPKWLFRLIKRTAKFFGAKFYSED